MGRKVWTAGGGVNETRHSSNDSLAGLGGKRKAIASLRPRSWTSRRAGPAPTIVMAAKPGWVRLSAGMSLNTLSRGTLLSSRGASRCSTNVSVCSPSQRRSCQPVCRAMRHSETRSFTALLHRMRRVARRRLPSVHRRLSYPDRRLTASRVSGLAPTCVRRASPPANCSSRLRSLAINAACSASGPFPDGRARPAPMRFASATTRATVPCVRSRCAGSSTRPGSSWSRWRERSAGMERSAGAFPPAGAASSCCSAMGRPEPRAVSRRRKRPGAGRSRRPALERLRGSHPLAHRPDRVRSCQPPRHAA